MENSTVECAKGMYPVKNKLHHVNVLPTPTLHPPKKQKHIYNI